MIHEFLQQLWCSKCKQLVQLGVWALESSHRSNGPSPGFLWWTKKVWSQWRFCPDEVIAVSFRQKRKKKIIKTWYYSASYWNLGNVLTLSVGSQWSSERTFVWISLQAVAFVPTATATCCFRRWLHIPKFSTLHTCSLAINKHSVKPSFTAMLRPTQPSTLRGMVKWVQCLWVSNKWQYWMRMVAVQGVWFGLGLATTWRSVCIHQMKQVNSCNGLLSWQHRKHSPGHYYPHMPISKVLIYSLLFVILFVCLYGYGFLRRG